MFTVYSSVSETVSNLLVTLNLFWDEFHLQWTWIWCPCSVGVEHVAGLKIYKQFTSRIVLLLVNRTNLIAKDLLNIHDKHLRGLILWEHTGSNRGPSACKADALNQLSYAPLFWECKDKRWIISPKFILQVFIMQYQIGVQGVNSSISAHLQGLKPHYYQQGNNFRNQGEVCAILK